MRLFYLCMILLVLHGGRAVAPHHNVNEDEFLGNEDILEELGRDIVIWWFVPRTEYMKDQDFLDGFHNALEEFAVQNSGQPEHVYQSRSDYLGTIFFTIKLFITKDPEELWDGYKDFLISYGEVPREGLPRRIQNHEDVTQFKPKLKAKPVVEMEDQENPEQNATLSTRSDGLVFGRVTHPKDVEAWEEPFEDLQKLSQPKDVPLSELRGQYYRRAAKGQDSTVYVIDWGAWVSKDREFEHKELSGIQLVDYLFAGPDPAIDMVDSWKEFYHGTKVLSRIAGRRLGTAPLAKIVIVRNRNKFGYVTAAHLFDAILKTYDHIVQTKPKFAVLNMSFYIPMGDTSGEWFNGDGRIIHKITKDYDHPDSGLEQEATGVLTTPEVVLKIMKLFTEELEKLGNVKIVACISNDERDLKSLPSDEMTRFPKTVVAVGAVGSNNQIIGQYWEDLKIYAPSTNVMVASYDQVDDSATIVPSNGVSFATGTVSGILASFVSEGVPIDDVVEHLYKLAHSRKPPGTEEEPQERYAPIVFNGVERNEWPLTIGDQEGLEEYILP
ncbi:hypothetical protein TWF481_000661 [Arthrobotrys musiformis]|uniref:Peptidase S8/S53 domain-containing protein n=1 Tax=Arthrobotrys musiformis TaxID=47236 RepID=A0AAV9WN81_9PEZI